MHCRLCKQLKWAVTHYTAYALYGLQEAAPQTWSFVSGMQQDYASSAFRYHFLKLGLQLILYCTPTRPGYSRVFYIMFAEKHKLPRSKQFAAALTPSWMKFAIHFVRNDTLDGDNFFLHIQVSQVAAHSVDDYHTPRSPPASPLQCSNIKLHC